MPIVSGGGGTFNGGTITRALTVAPSDVNASPLLSLAGADPTVLPVVSVSNAPTLLLDALVTGHHPQIIVRETGTGAARVAVGSQGTVLARGDSGEIALSNTANTVAFFDVYDGFFGFTQNAVPPNGNFDNNGMCALWLDATPGATKLMIKALDSAGTARTASITLA